MKRNEFDSIRLSIFNGYKDNKGRTGTLGEFLYNFKPGTTDEDNQVIVGVGDVRRADGDHKKQSNLKARLPQASISALCPQGRGTDKPFTHTGLICVDIDAKDNPRLSAQQIKDIVCSIRQTLYCSYSVSNKGVFAIMRISNPQRHKEHFRALQRLFKFMFGIVIDPQNANPKHTRCATVDYDAYFNGDAEAFEIMDGDAPAKVPAKAMTSSPSAYGYDSTLAKAEVYVKEIERMGVDIAPEREEWMRIGFALHTLGDDGRALFRRISDLWSRGTTTDAAIDTLWKSAKDEKASGVTMGTFFDVCKRYGVHPFEIASPSREQMFAGVYLDDAHGSEPGDSPQPEPEYKDGGNWIDDDDDLDDM